MTLPLPSTIWVFWLALVWLAAVAAPVGSDTVPVMLVIFHAPDWVAATVESGVSVVICAAVSTTGIELAANCCPSANDVPPTDARSVWAA